MILKRSFKHIALFFILIFSGINSVYSQGLEQSLYHYSNVFNEKNTDKSTLLLLQYLDENWYCIENKKEYIHDIINTISDEKQIQFLYLLIVNSSIKKSNIEEASYYISRINEQNIYFPGIYFFSKARMEEVLNNGAKQYEFLNEALKSFSEDNNYEGMVFTYKLMIYMFKSIGDISNASDYFSKALYLSEKYLSDIEIADLYQVYAATMAEYDLDYSIELFQKSYDLAKSNSDHSVFLKISTEYLKYLLRYKSRNEFEKIYYDVQKIVDFDQSCLFYYIAKIYTFQAHYFTNINQIDSAIYYNEKALYLRLKAQSNRIAGYSYLNLYNNYLNANRIENALIMLDSAENYLYTHGSLLNKRQFISYKLKILKQLDLNDSLTKTYDILLGLESEYIKEQKLLLTNNLQSKNELNIKLQKDKYDLELERRRLGIILLLMVSVGLIFLISVLIIRLKNKTLGFQRLSFLMNAEKQKTLEYKQEVNRLKNIFKNTNYGFLIFDKNLKLQFYNSAAEYIFDQVNPLKIGKVVSDFFPKQNIKDIESVLSSVLKSKENFELLLDFEKRTNKRLVLSISFSPLMLGKNVESVLLIITDVSESTRALEMEKQQSQVLQTLFNSVTESVLLIDSNWRVELINETAASRFGKSIDELLGKEYLEILPVAFKQNRKNKLEEVYREKKAVLFNEEIDSYNSIVSYFPSKNTNDEVEFVVEFSQDITEKKMASDQINSLRQRVLRSQMNPHFIFNSLNAIQSYVLKNDSLKAVKYLNSFAKLIRMILDSSRSDYISLTKEIDILNYYLDLQQLRFGDKFEYQLDLDKDLDIDNLWIPAMLAQPFIENSIEHGLQHLDTKGKVKISFKRNKESIVFMVMDNGIGRKASQEIQKKMNHKKESLSTHLFEERIHTLNKYSGKKITFNIIDLKDDNGAAKGTMVVINLPMIYKTDVGLF